MASNITPSKIAPCLWFDNQAQEAARFYTSVFPDSSIDHVARSPIDTPGGQAGDVILVAFTIAGHQYQALNAGPSDPFNNRVSLSVACKDQAEVDRYWEALTADGGEEVQCGWLRDKYGVRWQIVPDAMLAMLRDENAEKAGRAMEAMVQMKKLDIATLKRAYDG